MAVGRRAARDGAAAPGGARRRARSCSASATTSATRTGSSRSSCWRSCARAGGTGASCWPARTSGTGSSRGDEAAYLAPRPELGGAVHDLPAVDEAEKAWLYEHAAAVVYPTVVRGLRAGAVRGGARRDPVPVRAAGVAGRAAAARGRGAGSVGRRRRRRSAPCRCSQDGDERRRHIELLTAAAAAHERLGQIVRALLDVYETAVEAAPPRGRARGGGPRAEASWRSGSASRTTWGGRRPGAACRRTRSGPCSRPSRAGAYAARCFGCCAPPTAHRSPEPDAGHKPRSPRAARARSLPSTAGA